MMLAQVLVKLLHAISVFNFNLELLSLECSVSVNFTTRWYVVLLLHSLAVFSVLFHTAKICMSL
jgi:hypothetical protein